MKRTAKAIAVLGLVAGCASIVSGTSQQVTIDSNPKGADCTLTRDGQMIGNVRTPGGLVIKKTKHDIAIDCGKEGYQRSTATLASDVESTTFGNLLIGGAIGWAIDSATGADNKYDDVITVALVPDIAGGGQGQGVASASSIRTSTTPGPKPTSLGSAKAAKADAPKPIASATIAPPAPPPSTAPARSAATTPAPKPTSLGSTKAADVDPPKAEAPAPMAATPAPAPSAMAANAPPARPGPWHTTDDRVRMHISPADSAPGIAMPRVVPLTMLAQAKDWGLFRYETADGGQAQGWILMANVEKRG